MGEWEDRQVTNIYEDLYMGSMHAPHALSFLPDLHLACAEEIQPTHTSARNVTWLKIDDRNEDWLRVPRFGRKITAAALDAAGRVDNDQTVVITCHLGVNRSGLLTALTLCALGADPAMAIEALRDLRQTSPPVLSTRSFVAVIHELGPELKRVFA